MFNQNNLGDNKHLYQKCGKLYDKKFDKIE